MRRENPILIVTASPEVANLLRGELEPHSSVIALAADAERIVLSTVLGGMVVDIPSNPSAGREIVRAYLRHQPTGRIAVLAHCEDVTTLTAFAYRDGKLDLFFEPWNMKMLRQFLGVPVGA